MNMDVHTMLSRKSFTWCMLAHEELDHSSTNNAAYQDKVGHVSIYNDSGFFSAVAKSRLFARSTLIVTCLFLLYVGIESDYNDGGVKMGVFFQLGRGLFCIFFTAEVLVILLAHRSKRVCFKDKWFTFNFFLAVFMVMEAYILPFILHGGMSLLSLLRLFRLLYLARVLHKIQQHVPELAVVIKGVLAGSRSVSFIMLLLMLTVYSFGIIMKVLSSGSDDMVFYWGSVPRSMWTLLFSGLFLDEITQIVGSMLKAQAYLSVFGFFLFMFIATITFMNMVIGVLCETTLSVSQSAADELAQIRIKASFVSQLVQFDDGDGAITRNELGQVLKDPVSAYVLRSLDVNMLYLAELNEMLFEDDDDKTISIDSIVELMMMCRGSVPATVEHIANGFAFLGRLTNKSEARILKHVSALVSRDTGVVEQC